MRRVWRASAIAFLALLLAAPAAQAQYGGGFGGGAGIGGFGDKSVEGTIQGTVRSLNLERGLVRVSSGAGTVTLHATPEQLVDVELGAIYDFEYAKYGNWLWMTGSAGGFGGGGFGGAGFAGDDFGSEGTVSGVVTRLNFERGLIYIDGRPYRTHPADLQGVLPGQLVSLSFRQIGSTNWIEGYGGFGGGIDGGGFGGSAGGGFGGSGGAVRGGGGFP
ncbi:MAG: hypothetical protein ACOX6T_27795 [Myxococcales bacterium]|jgi:hypothetical protein